MGTSYWGGLVDWLRGSVLAGGKISPRDLDLIHVTDDVEEAVRLIDAGLRGHNGDGHGSGGGMPTDWYPPVEV